MDFSEATTDDAAVAVIDCPFCRLQLQPASERAPADTVLFESPNFLVVPTVGPFAAGHVLVISRRHYTSFAALPLELRHEYETLVRTVSILVDADILEFEHGSGPANGPSGSCIDHLHVHVMPQCASAVGSIDGLLPTLIVDFADLSECDVPYIWLRANGESRLFDAGGVPSQYGRKCIWEWFGRDDWDWAASPNLRSIMSTISMFSRPI